VSKHKIRPRSRPLSHISFANNLTQSLHPPLLLSAGIGVEVNRLAVSEADPETFFDVLIPLVFLGECTLTAAFTWVTARGVSYQGGLVVDEAGGFGEVDDSALLVGVFVVGG